jgi:hypothetical protein
MLRATPSRPLASVSARAAEAVSGRAWRLARLPPAEDASPRLTGSPADAAKAVRVCLHAVASCALLTAGCALSNADLRTEERVRREPALGEVARARVGEPIYTEHSYSATGVATIPSGHSSALGLGSVTISPADRLIGRTMDGGIEYCTSGNTFSDPLIGPYAATCFRDADGDSSFDQIRSPAVFLGAWRDLEEGVPYRRTDAIRQGSGARRELILENLTRDAVSVVYREDGGDGARRSRSETLTYSLAGEPDVISLGNAEIQIVDAHNGEIIYRVLSGF